MVTFENWLVSGLKPCSFLYALSLIIFSYASLSSWSVMRSCSYALASSASNLYCAIFGSGFGGVPNNICTGPAAFAFAFAGTAAGAAAAAAAFAFAGGGAAELDDDDDDAAAAGGCGGDSFAFDLGGSLGLSLSDELTTIVSACCFFSASWPQVCIRS